MMSSLLAPIGGRPSHKVTKYSFSIRSNLIKFLLPRRTPSSWPMTGPLSLDPKIKSERCLIGSLLSGSLFCGGPPPSYGMFRTLLIEFVALCILRITSGRRLWCFKKSLVQSKKQYMTYTCLSDMSGSLCGWYSGQDYLRRLRGVGQRCHGWCLNEFWYKHA